MKQLGALSPEAICSNSERLAVLSAEIKTNPLKITAIIVLLPLLNVSKFLQLSPAREGRKGRSLPERLNSECLTSDLLLPMPGSCPLELGGKAPLHYFQLCRIRPTSTPQPSASGETSVLALARDNLLFSYTF